MRTHTIECPAGLVVTIRTFEVEDEDLLGNPASVRAGLAYIHLMEALTVSVESPGLYPLTQDGKVAWRKVLQGEREVILRDNRVRTWGAEYEASKPCPNCRQPTKNTFDVSTFPLKALPESSRDHVVNGTPLSCVLPVCGKQVKFRLLRGEDDKGLQSIAKDHKDKMSSKYLRFRVSEIQDVKTPDLEAFIRKMDGQDSAFLRSAMDEADCGIDQEGDHTCGSCGHEWRDDVPFKQGFLFPKFQRKTTTGK